MANNEAVAQDQPDSQGRRRSPSWPFIPLPKALERAREFYKVHRDKAATPSAANVSWSMKPKSGAGGQTIATMRQYGLMGEGESSGIRLTDLALRIIRDTRDVSPDRDDLIRQAAIKPKIFAEMWEKWEEGVPNDADVQFYLVQEKSFTEEAAKGILNNYKASLRFAKMTGSDSLFDNDAGTGAQTIDPVMTPAKNPPPPSARLMEGERIVFTHEIEPAHGVRILASGNVDDAMLDALDVYVELQRKRLGRRELNAPSGGGGETSPVPPVDKPQVRSAPRLGVVLITKANKMLLREKGYTDEQINKMKPEEALEILGI